MIETTNYLLDCGHTADVYGPCGATTGRAWCSECGCSAAVVREVPRPVLPGGPFDPHVTAELLGLSLS